MENAILSEKFAFKRIMLCVANINFPNRVILVNENLILQSYACAFYIRRRRVQALNMATQLKGKFNGSEGNQHFIIIICIPLRDVCIVYKHVISRIGIYIYIYRL